MDEYKQFCDTLLKNFYNSLEEKLNGNNCFKQIIKERLYIEHSCDTTKKIPIHILLIDWVNRSYIQAKRTFHNASDTNITGSEKDWEFCLNEITNIASECGISVKRVNTSDLVKISEAVIDVHDSSQYSEFAYVEISFGDQKYYIRFDICYDSYNGTSLESFKYVVPKTLTVTTFE